MAGPMDESTFLLAGIKMMHALSAMGGMGTFLSWHSPFGVKRLNLQHMDVIADGKDLVLP